MFRECPSKPFSHESIILQNCSAGYVVFQKIAPICSSPSIESGVSADRLQFLQKEISNVLDEGTDIILPC